MAIRPRDLNSLIEGADENRSDTADGIQEAGLFSGVGKSAARQAIDPLTKRGARTSPDYRVVEPDNTVPPAVSDEPPAAPVSDVPSDVAETLPEAPAPPTTVTEPPKPISEDALAALEAERAAQIGTARQAPSPTKAQKLAGVERGPARTTFYDEDELAATVQAVAKTMTVDTGRQSIQSIRDKAFASGVPEKQLKRMFDGLNLEGEIGNNKLAIQLASLQALHDESAQRVDALMAKAASNELDSAGKLDLRQELAQHEIIFTALSGAKSDVARSMNVFKNIRNQTIGATQVKAALDSFGGDDQLRALAEKYVTTETRAGKNKIVKTSLGKKIYESWIYMAQSMALTAFDTHLYNMAGGMASILMDVPERAAAIPFGIARQAIQKAVGIQPNPERYYADEVMARATGFRNGLIDGVHMAAKKIRDYDPSAKDASRNPVSSAYWANTEIANFRGKVISIDAMDGAVGKMVDAIGNVYASPFVALGAGDEIFGGIAARMELHEQAYNHAKKIIDDALASGSSEKEAIEKAEQAAIEFLTERPADVEASVQAWRKQATLQDDIDRTTKTGKAFHLANKMISSPILKPLVLFSKTVTNIGIEAGARSPLFFASPRFHTEWNKGGKYRDLALGRAAFGSGIMIAGVTAAQYDKITGQGPPDTEERRNLRSAGWQPFAYKAGEGEISSEVVKRLQGILGEDAVTVGTGQFTGYTYISLKRLEPISAPFLMGAAFSDALKFRQYDPDDTIMGEMASASVAAVAEYSQNLSSLQAINELASIFNQRQTDGGERFLAIVDALAKRYGSTMISGTPGLGMANSTIVARIESMIDPTVRASRVTEDQITTVGARGFVEAWNKFQTRIPGISEDALPIIDEYGNTPGLDKTLWYTPLTATVAERSELTEMLAAINHGYSKASNSYNGVYLPAEAYYRRNDLAANKIMVDGLRLAEANLMDVQAYLDDAKAQGITPRIGIMQSIVDSNVSEYRNLAHERMFGKMVKNPDGTFMHTGEAAGSDYGLGNDKIEFPGLAAEMLYEKNKRIMYGR